MTGRTIDGYVIGDYLGGGQFGEVYKAEKDGVVYAIKFIRKSFLYEDYRDGLLRREIGALKRVSSEYAIKYFGDGNFLDGHVEYAYIVMEFVEGKTLRDILSESHEPWEERRAIDFVESLLHGLADIHNAGVIHRDLKPENIKITTEGKIKILDYGLSKIVDYSSITQTGYPIGTFFYMSPEQAKGDKPLKPGTDFYSIGVILYELLTGKILFFPSTNAQIIHKTINVKPPYPSSINPRISNQIENVTLKLLAKEVYQRYPTIDDILTAISEEPKQKVESEQENVKFYLRVIQNDTAIVQDFFHNNTVDGIDFPINLHAGYQTLSKLIRKHSDSITYFADPGTNRMAFTHFRKTKGLRELPYAPQGYDALTPDVFADDGYLREFSEKVIETQISSGCNLLIAPFFYFDNVNDDWFPVNIKLLRESIDYVRKNYPQYKISGAICTQAEILCRQKERETIIEDYGHCSADYMQFYIDKIHEGTGDAQLFNFIGTAKAIKEYGKCKIVACRVPTIALGLLTVGFDAITSGLGVLDTFNRDLIVKEEDASRMPTRYYFPDLLTSVSTIGTSKVYDDIVAHEAQLRSELPKLDISLSCKCEGCLHDGLSQVFQKPRLHFLHAITNELKVLNAVADRKEYFLQRIDKAYTLQQKLASYGIKLNSPVYLQTWKEILSKH